MKENYHFYLETMETPIGDLIIVADQDGALRALDWLDYEDRYRTLQERYYRKFSVNIEKRPVAENLTKALKAYFSGDLTAIDALPVKTNGSVFQEQAWAALRRIPCGTTVSYKEQAINMGNPKAVRAVGLANGANPIGIVIPCHRVIGSNGKLTGYGGGMERKRWLLEHEGMSLKF